MSLIYLVPFQNVPKIDLTIVSTSFTLTMYALNYSYLIEVPTIGYENGTLNSNPLLTDVAAYSLTLPAVVGYDTSLTDNVQLVTTESFVFPPNLIVALDAGDLGMTDNIMMVSTGYMTVNGVDVTTPATGDTTLVDNVLQTYSPSVTVDSFSTFQPSAILDTERDTYVALVLLNLHADGANAATTTVDAVGKAMTMSNSTLSTAFKQFGTSSINLNSGASYVSTPNIAAWNFTASNVTLEMWVYLPAGFGFQPLIGQATALNDSHWFSYIRPDGSLCIGKNGVNEIASPAGTFVAGKWNHVAFVKTNVDGLVRIFYNGTQVASATTAVFDSSAQLLVLGTYAAAMTSLLTPNTVGCYIDEVRVTKAARYVADFSVPAAAGTYPY